MMTGVNSRCQSPAPSGAREDAEVPPWTLPAAKEMRAECGLGKSNRG